MEKNKFDASTIDFSRCDMDGAALCSCAPEELRLVFGPLGDQLYAQLWDLSECGPCAQGPRSMRGPGPGLGPIVWDQRGSRKDWSPGAGREPHHLEPLRVRRAGQLGADPSAPSSASSFPDELSWIIDMLEQDSTSFQETLGDPGPFGEHPRPHCPPQPVGPAGEVSRSSITSMGGRPRPCPV